MLSLFAIIRFYPYWAFPIAFILGELGLHYRRKANQRQYYCWGLSGFMGLTGVLWILFRGDLNSDAWVRWFLEAF